jgi:hypothetical protein
MNTGQQRMGQVLGSGKDNRRSGLLTERDVNVNIVSGGETKQRPRTEIRFPAGGRPSQLIQRAHRSPPAQTGQATSTVGSSVFRP